MPLLARVIALVGLLGVLFTGCAPHPHQDSFSDNTANKYAQYTFAIAPTALGLTVIGLTYWYTTQTGYDVFEVAPGFDVSSISGLSGTFKSQEEAEGAAARLRNATDWGNAISIALGMTAPPTGLYDIRMLGVGSHRYDTVIKENIQGYYWCLIKLSYFASVESTRVTPPRRCFEKAMPDELSVVTARPLFYQGKLKGACICAPSNIDQPLGLPGA